MPWGRGFGWAWRSGYWPGYCRAYPWLPRRWWAGTYGPVYWTPEGPKLGEPTKEEELSALKVEREALKGDIESLNKALQELEERIKQLEASK